jgi:ABC-type transport system substrate-binding protein
MDALVDRLNGTADAVQRYAIAAEAGALLREEVPAVYLMTPLRHVAMTPRVQSYAYQPNDFYLVSEKLALA